MQVGKGAVDAVLIPANDIYVEDELAKVCSDPGCHNYGASPGCPPNVSGPPAFRKWLESYNQALFVKIEVPKESLLSHEYKDIMRMLHEVIADIEQEAVKTGYPNSKGFAGGSCKELFCSAYTDCNVLERNSECRNPGRSRPSMSGFGINVSKLKARAGWKENNQTGRNKAGEIEMAAVYGLVLIG
ncbi:MAG: DUF2284 domain-containing protein [Bacillota bacterium]